MRFYFLIMKKIILIILMISTLLGLSGCQSLWYQFLNFTVDKHHLGHFVKTSLESQHTWLEIPEVGHEATEIFTYPRFITELKTLDF
jgi:hypothetical protein